MTRRVLCVALFAAAISVVAIVAKLRADRQSLHQYLDFIQREYTGPLSAIEGEMNQISTEFYSIDDAQSRLRDCLSARQIYSASWSFDGHHSARPLKHFPSEGLSTFKWCSAEDRQSGRRLYFGRGFEGKPLLILEAEVRSSPVLHIYTVAFDESEIQRKMKVK